MRKGPLIMLEMFPFLVGGGDPYFNYSVSMLDHIPPKPA